MNIAVRQSSQSGVAPGILTFRNQLDDPKFKEVPFEDRLGMLVDIEYSNRKNNRQKRLIRNAGFDQPEAVSWISTILPDES